MFMWFLGVPFVFLVVAWIAPGLMHVVHVEAS